MPARSTSHGRTGESSLNSPRVLLLMWQWIVLMIPLLHHCVLDEPDRWVVSFHCVPCCDFCFAHFCHAVSERNDCWFRSLSLFKADTLLQSDAARDVMMPIFFHRNARYTAGQNNNIIDSQNGELCNVTVLSSVCHVCHPVWCVMPCGVCVCVRVRVSVVVFCFVLCTLNSQHT